MNAVSREGVKLKKVFGVTFGSLQKKVVTLVMIVIILTVGLLALVSYYQNQMLVNIVEDTRNEQQQAISRTSEETMSKILETSIIRTTVLEAQKADHEFSEVVNDVQMLRRMAVLLLRKNEPTSEQLMFPDPANDGTVSAMILTEEGIDYRTSADLPVIAKIKDTMIALDTDSEKINGCYIGLADGTHFVVDDMSSDKVDENGDPLPFPVRQRPWYKGAVEADGIYFTGIIRDAFSGELGITCSVPIKHSNQLVGVVGIDIVLESMDELINFSRKNNDFVIVVNDQGHVILAPSGNGLFTVQAADQAEDLRKSDNRELAEFITTALEKTTDLKLITIGGKEFYMVGSPMPTAGWAVVSIIDKEITEEPERVLLSEYDQINELASSKFKDGQKTTIRSSILLVLGVLLVALFLSLSASHEIAKPIEIMTKNIKRSNMSGKLFEMNDAYRTNDEIEILAESFCELSKQTKKYINDITEITKEKERVRTEMQLANRIQHNSIPHVFPPFPDRDEFEIYASMDPAREVGGDFYDYYLIDDDHLCLVISDVSGKGVPGALFMMISKVIVQNLAMLGKGPAEILAKANEAICANNNEEMFVTVWIGILEISTGRIIAANAGHEYPAIMKNGKFELLKDRHGFVIGGMEGMTYKEYEISLEPGDKLFVYTDGVPESTNAENEMFGTDRMIDVLNEDPQADPEKILKRMSTAIDDFVLEAEQFDDITMMCITYHGKKKDDQSV